MCPDCWCELDIKNYSEIEKLVKKLKNPKGFRMAIVDQIRKTVKVSYLGKHSIISVIFNPPSIVESVESFLKDLLAYETTGSFELSPEVKIKGECMDIQIIPYDIKNKKEESDSVKENTSVENKNDANSETNNGVNDVVNHPTHYTSSNRGIECIDAIYACLDSYKDHPIVAWLCGNVIKYIWRAPLKGKFTEDLKKAQFYMNEIIKEIEK